MEYFVEYVFPMIKGILFCVRRFVIVASCIYEMHFFICPFEVNQKRKQKLCFAACICACHNSPIQVTFCYTVIRTTKK